MNKQSKKIKIGISSCLLGLNVRYDGGNKWHALINEVLVNDFEWVSVCPEVEGGLSIPRPPIQIELKHSNNTDLNNLEILEVQNKNNNHTQKLFSFALAKVPTLNEISGFIAKSNSPSCGMKVPYFNTENLNARATKINGPGFFIKILKDQFPTLPIIDELDLDDPILRNNFIKKVHLYSKMRL